MSGFRLRSSGLVAGPLTAEPSCQPKELLKCLREHRVNFLFRMTQQCRSAIVLWKPLLCESSLLVCNSWLGGQLGHGNEKHKPGGRRWRTSLVCRASEGIPCLLGFRGHPLSVRLQRASLVRLQRTSLVLYFWVPISR